MCIALLTLEHPEYALMLCTNRDEFLVRPTQTAHFHSAGRILSGIDVQAGGTWCGLSTTGRVALLTNITEDTHANFAHSRGHLVSSFLERAEYDHDGDHDGDDDDDDDDVKQEAYAGFNLLLLKPKRRPGVDGLAYDARLATNCGAGGTVVVRALSPAERAYAGISNADGAQPDALVGAAPGTWPKVRDGLARLRAVVEGPPAGTEDALIEQLFAVLATTPTVAPICRADLRTAIQIDPLVLPTPAPATPDADHANPHLTYYATRTATVLLVRRTGQVVFVERDKWVLGSAAEDGDTGEDRSGGPAERTPALASPASQRVFRFTLSRQS